jgi:hypothetical protein
MSSQLINGAFNVQDFEAKMMQPFAAAKGCIQLAWISEWAHQLQPH